MHIYHRLETLKTNVWLLQGLFDKSTKANAKETLDKLNGAKQLLKAFKRDNMPHLLEQPKHNIKQIPFIPMDTWCEQFENLNN